MEEVVKLAVKEERVELPGSSSTFPQTPYSTYLSWKSFLKAPIPPEYESAIKRSLLSLGMTSGMAGEGVGGSVGELEMAAWLQQVLFTM